MTSGLLCAAAHSSDRASVKSKGEVGNEAVGHPGEKDFIDLAPGEVRTSVVDLSAFYDMYQTGTYSVRYHSHMSSNPANGAEGNRQVVSDELHEIQSNNAQIYVIGDGYSQVAAYEAAYEAIRAVNAAPTYKNCSTTRRTQLGTAHTSAQSYANNSVNYFAGRTYTSVTTRYTTWFGASSSTRFNNAKSHYAKIQDERNNKPVVYNCACDPPYASAFAYVNPAAPCEITLCGAFWPASNTGTDSKAGTIIHESSHSNIVAGTDDWAYGQTDAKALARSNATRAVDNADNHEYFSEKTPAQN